MGNRDIVIVGAGMAGLTAARALADAGHQAIVLDKGRGPGGRLATRLTREGPRFDHGAQYVTARSKMFRAFLDDARRAGHADIWERFEGRDRWVGVPGMSGLAAQMSQGLDVRCGIEVRALERRADGWKVDTGEGALTANRLVLTVPPVQASRLLGDHPLAGRLDAVEMAPCLTLMAAFAPGGPVPFVRRDDPDGDLAFIAHDGGKPRRDGGATWVAHAGIEWSGRHLEADKVEIARLMLPMLAAAIGREAGEAVLTRGHRWRYARTLSPLGSPFLADGNGLWIGGDWCLGARVEAAWESGRAIADAVVADAV